MKWIAFTKPDCCFEADKTLKRYPSRKAWVREELCSFVLIIWGQGRVGLEWTAEAEPCRAVFSTETQSLLTRDFLQSQEAEERRSKERRGIAQVRRSQAVRAHRQVWTKCKMSLCRVHGTEKCSEG